MIRRETLPGAIADRSEPVRLSQAAVLEAYRAKAVPTEKAFIFKWRGDLSGVLRGGNNRLLTMFARQDFPSWPAKERFR
jgi:hypothetical protein